MIAAVIFTFVGGATPVAVTVFSTVSVFVTVAAPMVVVTGFSIVFSTTSDGFKTYPKAPPTTKPPIAAPVYFK